MQELTDFQEIVAMALEISDEQAATVQKAWPGSERELRQSLRQWKIATGSEVKGHDLLAICREIWQQKPVRQDLAEGREVRYHPANGSPINADDPMDRIPTETLAFLRWAIRIGGLQWSDEIAIVREVLAAEGDIQKLPADRFYAKSMLPRFPNGEIDWSDLDLAQAKDFILNGGRRAGATLASTYQPQFQETTLEGVLASIPGMGDTSARSMLLRGLPLGAVGSIRRSSATATDVYNIVDAARGMGRLSNGHLAINIVIENALAFVRGTAKEQVLIDFKE